MLRRFQYFKCNTILNLLSSSIYIVANVLFWYCVSDAGFLITGWSFSDVMVFIAFSELFYSIESALFLVASRFWRVIYSGALDTLMTRPLDPRVRFIILNVNYTQIIHAGIKFIALLILARRSLSISLVLAGVLIVLVANSILAIIRLCFSYSAFWLGKMDAMSELADCITQFNKYPLTIMPKVVKMVCTFVFPFYFFSTFSTEILIHKISHQSILIGGIGMLFNILLWGSINKVLWNKGREKYESIHG